ncbi:hypothetical protein ES705_09990 [subsurface metagenome]
MRKNKVSAAFKHFEKVVKKPDIEKDVMITYFKNVPYGLDYGLSRKQRFALRGLMLIKIEMTQNRKNNLRRKSVKINL